MNKVESIAILGNFITYGSNEVFLKKYLCLLLAASKKVVVFSDWTFEGNGNVQVINSVRAITNNIRGSSPISRLIRYFLVQLVLTYSLMRHSKESKIIFSFDVLLILPIAVAKMLRKKVIFFAAARLETSYYETLNIKTTLLSKILELVKNSTFNLADCILIESKSLVKWLYLDKFRGKISLGPTFVDTKIFSFKNNIDQRDDIIGYIGNFSELKGVMNFVQAVPDILANCPNTTFLIVGDGPCREKIERFIGERGLTDKVKLCGWLSPSKIAECLVSLKLLIIPSKSEGLPNIVLESMACGTPVFANAVGGIPDVVLDEKTGFIMMNNSVESISQRLPKILMHSDLSRITKSALTLIENEYSYGAAVKRYRLLIQRLLHVCVSE